ncbi:MAG: AraC family transcriptional regulator [Flavobacterium sp.]|nr:MAG: AraC family transcriptional regulator [Flavobacterium sp.]
MAEKIPIRKIKQTQLEPALAGSFSIRFLQDVLDGKDMNESLHRHEFFLILVLKQAKGTHEIDFVSYDVTNQSIFLLRPGQVHRLSLKAGSTGYIVQFKNDFFSSKNASATELLRKVSHKKICNVEGSGFGAITATLDNIYKEYTEKREGYEDIIKSNLNIFFIELVRQRQNTESQSEAINPYSQEKLEKLFELLDLNIVDSKQVSYYADKLNLSTYQLGAITKTLLSKTPSELINEHIVLEAKRQLLATSNQVNQIAYQLGYEDVSYFIRFFKKHTGHSPDSFRTISK